MKPDNRDKDYFWDYKRRPRPCKVDCKDKIPYQNGTVLSKGKTNWNWQYKPIKRKEPIEDEDDDRPRVWVNI